VKGLGLLLGKCSSLDFHMKWSTVKEEQVSRHRDFIILHGKQGYVHGITFFASVPILIFNKLLLKLEYHDIPIL
jgi:hypothetical protein